MPAGIVYILIIYRWRVGRSEAYRSWKDLAIFNDISTRGERGRQIVMQYYERERERG